MPDSPPKPQPGSTSWVRIKAAVAFVLFLGCWVLIAIAPQAKYGDAEVDGRIANIMRAIEAGILTPTTKARLTAAEAERESLAVRIGDEAPAVGLIPDAVKRYREMVAALPEMVTRAPDRAREILLRALRKVELVPRADGLYASVNAAPAQLLGLDAGCVGSGGAHASNSTLIVPFSNNDLQRRATPEYCGNGHALSPNNVHVAGRRWRCRQCGAERALRFRLRGP